MLCHALGVPIDIIPTKGNIAVNAGQAGGRALAHMSLQFWLHSRGAC